MICRLGDREPVFDGDGHFVAENAIVVGSVRLGSGSSVWFGAVVRGDNDWIDIGAGSNIQDNAVLHTDPGIRLHIGESVTVGHRAVLHGCRIGAHTLVGIGSTIMNEARIGSHCVVAAHALVTERREFPDGVLLMGAPARIARELTPEEIAGLREPAATYRAKAAHYRQDLQRLG